MASLLRTVLYERHVELGARTVEFGGWQMPVQYPAGILAEHLDTRNQAGLFDVSHMGRFIISGRDALAFLQYALTNNAAALETGQSQYTLLADPHGGAVDDAYRYRFFEDSYLLVVNAANREKDWRHLQALQAGFEAVNMEDHTHKIAMISVQGPRSKKILSELLGPRALPESQRNAVSTNVHKGHQVWLGRTGYIGEPLIEVRGRKLRAGVMPYLMRSEAPPLARSITWLDYQESRQPSGTPAAAGDQISLWLRKAMDNTIWRRRQCINLIPSEMTLSPLVRLLSILDPVGRYAEHKSVKAFTDAEIFYYQGTDFIQSVEEALAEQMRLFLGCRQVETRPISGQMANMVLFSAMVDFLNRGDRKVEQRRIRKVMNHHIIKGGHLSAQPMGALRDFVMRDPRTERPAVINFPVLSENPYQVDIEACAALLEQHRPELVILGKSMIIHKEPVAAIRKLIEDLELDAILMYDMAHVVGLTGPNFQQPFSEGADLVTGSTHKTFFGTQRGIVAADLATDREQGLELWEAITRRAFPGSVSNHHLGTLLGLLAAATEMNTFKDQYQPAVIANAKAFAKALHQCGLNLAGDAAIDFTETHQVIVDVGYTQGPRIARALEANNIICNFQATPYEEGFTASGALRLGVAEMTRFGMQTGQFQTLAQLMADVILYCGNVKDKVQALREAHQDMKFCFTQNDIGGLMEQLHQMVKI